MVWDGGEQGTWDVESSKNWLNNGQADKFYALDNVEFTDSTANGTIDVASAATVTDFTVRSGTHTLTRSNGGYVAIAGSATIENGATLILGTETGSTGLLRGAITVKNGGTLQFNAKDVTGYSGGANSLQTITVDEGGSLVMNVDGNETFAGTLNLGGTIAKGDNAGNATAWDIWGNSSINVKSATAKIATNIRIGRQNAVITLDDGSMLTVSGNIVLRDSGSDTLKVDGGNGSGSFVFTGTSGTIGSGVKLGNGALTVGDGENASFLTVGRIEIGDNGSGNGEENSAVSRLNIEKNSTLKVTGATNTWSSTTDYKQNSVVLGEWSNTTHASIKGTLLAKDAEIGMGDWGALITVDGLLVAKGLGQAVKNAGDFAVTLNDGGKILVGESGISDKRSAQGEITLNAGTVGTYSDTTTLALGMTLNSDDGTIFDTQKYVFAEDGNSVSQGSDGGEISVTGKLSSTGKLIKSGAGTLTLSGDNTYSGGTTVSAGTLVAAHQNALGSGPLKLNGGTFGTSLDAFSVAGAVELGEGTTSTINLGKYTNGAFDTSVVARITIDNEISGAGSLTVVGRTDADDTSKPEDREQRLTLSGNNSYTGGTTLNGARVIAKNASALGAGNLSMDGAEVQIDTGALTVKNLNGSGNITLGGNTTSSVLTIESTDDTTFAGNLTSGVNNGSKTLDLVKTGAGTLSLTGTLGLNAVTVSDGALSVGGSIAKSCSSIAVASDAQLTVSQMVKVDEATYYGIYLNTLNLATDSKLVVDLEGVQAAGETITLNIVSATAAINLGASVEGVALATADVPAIEDFVSITGDKHLSDYVKQTWTLSNNTLSLTLAIPEPSLFGLLAGLGALTLVGTRRRKKA